jgi:hypothetical protein
MMEATILVLAKFKLRNTATYSLKAILCGHKKQGKSQLLHFFMVLFQNLGELVVYLDQGTVPNFYTNKVDDADHIYAREWKHVYEKNAEVFRNNMENNKRLDVCVTAINAFADNGRKDDFLKIMEKFTDFASENEKKIWILVDEVTRWIENKYTFLPSNDQEPSPFLFILTGNDKMGVWTDSCGFKKDIVDMPFLDKVSGWNLALSLAKEHNFNLVDRLVELGVHPEGAPEFIEKQFVGIPGYIAYFVMELKEIRTELSDSVFYGFSSRVTTFLDKVPWEDRWFAKSALNSIQCSNFDPWLPIRKLGICGSKPPPRQIEIIIMRWLVRWNKLDRIYSADELAKQCRENVLKGFLLELEMVTKMELGERIYSNRIELINKTWVQSEDDIKFFDSNDFSICVYNGQAIDTINPTSWIIIKVPPCFPIMDAFVVENTRSIVNFYAVQITRSKQPFVRYMSSPKNQRHVQLLVENVWSKLNMLGPTPVLKYAHIALKCDYNSDD